ncbi:uncharacterized protein IWZ02DRAFT_484229 [Phyllosticta citriasiana]|uniref:uncharacterized protein n=1 Tax=Phyllosticta citriasiana TaxID=595635 RepID=UPI0030FD2AF2
MALCRMLPKTLRANQKPDLPLLRHNSNRINHAPETLIRRRQEDCRVVLWVTNDHEHRFRGELAEDAALGSAQDHAVCSRGMGAAGAFAWWHGNPRRLNENEVLLVWDILLRHGRLKIRADKSYATNALTRFLLTADVFSLLMLVIRVLLLTEGRGLTLILDIEIITTSGPYLIQSGVIELAIILHDASMTK